MNRCPRKIAHAAVVLLAVAPLVAWAQSQDVHPLLDGTFNVDVGMFFPESTFEISVEGTIDPAPFEPIDFEGALGSDIDEQLGAVEFFWRFGDKWSLRAQYMAFEDRSSAALQEDVEWGDITFGAGTGIGAGLDTTITRLFLGRSFSKNDRREFGLGFGGHVLDISAFIEGNAIINGVPDGFRTDRVETSGVVPNLGAWYMHSFSSRWALTSRLDWLGADIGKYDGQIINFSIGTNFRLFKHVGIGLNYNWLEIDFGVDDDDWKGDLETRSHGLFAYVSAYW